VTNGHAALPFAASEYQGRLASVLAAMAEHRADLLLVDQIDSMAYISGYAHSGARYQALLIRADGSAELLIRGSDEESARRTTWVEKLTGFEDDEDEMAILGRLVAASNPRTLAIETDSHFLTIKRFEFLKSKFPRVRFADFAKVIWEQRLIKSPAEIECLRRASQIADACVRAGAEAVKAGRSEREPAIATYRKAIAMGADNGRVAVFGYGSTVANMHGRLGTRTMEDGELYFIEAVPQVHGYSARIARPIAVGHASDRHRHIADRIVEIQDRQIAAMVPGANAGDVDLIVREAMLREGLKKTFPQVSGYTLGYHAAPRTADHTRIFMRGESWTLLAGMVFHMILYSEGLPFSETILVSDDAPVRLTSTARTLMVQ